MRSEDTKCPFTPILARKTPRGGAKKSRNIVKKKREIVSCRTARPVDLMTLCIGFLK